MKVSQIILNQEPLFAGEFPHRREMSGKMRRVHPWSEVLLADCQKLDTYEDLPVPGVLAIFRDPWATEREQAGSSWVFTVPTREGSGKNGGLLTQLIVSGRTAYES